MEACDMFEKEKVALNNLKVGTVERPKKEGWQVDPLCTIMIERGCRACASQKGNIPIDQAAIEISVAAIHGIGDSRTEKMNIKNQDK